MAGLAPVSSKQLRHTYCSARIQTIDRGAPVSLDTVRREMGHGDESLVRNIYGHLGDIRHRSEVVEYRVAQHSDTLGDRVTQLEARVSGSANGSARGFYTAPSATQRA